MKPKSERRTLGAMIAFLLVLIFTSSASLALPGPIANETAIVFETMDGQTVDAFEGVIQVPENRDNPQSRKISVHYVRFPATTDKPGPPIIYLAGGPGGSGIMTAKYPRFRFPLFMALREHGDVIALDQRGTGAASSLPKCISSAEIALNRRFTDDKITNSLGVAAKECVGFWQQQGIDVAGYNTLESARDIDDLRQHLGANSVTLWGISYGSHLALASLKVMGNHVHKIVIASAEGLDQTVKLPSRTDAYFQRLQLAINTDAVAKALYPDINALVKRVHKHLEEQPILLLVPEDNKNPTEFLFQRFHMQTIASGMIADPHRGVATLLALYRGIDETIDETNDKAIYKSMDSASYPDLKKGLSEETEQMLTAVVKRAGLLARRITFDLMPLAMDVASGITAERLKQVEREAETSLLGLALNFPMPQLANEIPDLDLGDGFRVLPRSNVPTLLLSGSLDGRTYIEGQAEATAGLSNLTHVTVVNAGHNLFMSSPEVTEVIHQFLRGEEINKIEIVIPLPAFAS
tara:strand:- start:55240 stop:56805 length:1566 start_codon:yes stop_codon:yes gene_type:complete